jgi:hypothetical protein
MQLLGVGDRQLFGMCRILQLTSIVGLDVGSEGPSAAFESIG